ncbi:hypothetical protein ACUN29_41575 (plasmid) [Streptomyces sp. WC2508]|uniref:hypothetical protein n=1 Tax=Streptomyces sp. WC2508 TaxID=3461405 RepID=UPI0040448E00
MGDIAAQEPNSVQAVPHPLASGRPNVRRAFLGSFGPAFFDQAYTHKVYGREVPNAVIENAIGLMLCYDELWFLRREDCPADMQQLDFVKFVSDDAQLTKQVTEARAEGARALERHPGVRQVLMPVVTDPECASSPQWPSRAWHTMRKRYASQAELVRHHRHFLTEAMSRAGHSAALRPHALPFDLPTGTHPSPETGLPMMKRLLREVAQMSEWWMTDALQLGPMDYIVGTGSAIQLDDEQPDDNGLQFETHKVESLEEVLHLRSTDALGPSGAYQDYIGDLRRDKRIRDLRTFLAGRPSPDGSAAALAAEVEELIRKYQDEAFRQRHRPALLRGIGSMAISMTGNQLLPGLGGFLGALVNADRVISDHRFKKNTRWAMFVLDARAKRESSKPSAHGQRRG